MIDRNAKLASLPPLWGMVAMICSGPHALATTVLPMNLADLSDAAAQVIDAVVQSSTSQWNADHSAITTVVRFADVRYLKGRLAGSGDTFELVVPGGTVGNARLDLAGAPAFDVGQRWLLFLHPTYRVHPVVGIHRGAFRIIAEPGGLLTIADAAGEAVVGIDDEGFIRSDQDAESAQRAGGCVVKGVSGSVVGVVARGQARTAAMTYEDFLARLTPVLQVSRQYGLTRAAGQHQSTNAQAAALRLRSEGKSNQTGRVDKQLRSVHHGEIAGRGPNHAK